MNIPTTQAGGNGPTGGLDTFVAVVDDRTQPFDESPTYDAVGNLRSNTRDY